jgi:NADH-quinone oxidoreductase subunit J
MFETVLFYSLAGIAVISAFLVISRANPLVSALLLVVTFLTTAAIFATLAAPFLAVLQILIYAGAIMVLFIFVIMLVHLDKKNLKARLLTFGKIIGSVAALYMALVLIISVWKPPFLPAPLVGQAYLTPTAMGRALVSNYLVPFEVLSVLLLTAMVGAVVLAKKKL